MSEAIITLKNLAKQFPKAKTKALSTISVDIPEGKIVGIVGPDGAGKTTLIRLITGLLRPSEGSAVVCGLDPCQSAKTLHSLISYMPQQFGLYDDLTVCQNLELYARLRGIRKSEQKPIFEKLLNFSGLMPFQNRLAGNLSGGMKQKLGLISALLQKPRLLILDEPTVGVDPYARRELWKMVLALVEEGMTALWSTSYLDEAEKCDEVLLLNEGQLLFQGIPSDLTEKLTGRTFLINGIQGPKRKVLSHCLLNPAILDSVVQGMSVRVVLKKGEEKPNLLDLDAGEGAVYEEVPPRFEDAFIDILGGGPQDVSPLVKKMEHISKEEGEVIKAEGLTKKFGQFIATDHVDFTVKRGEIVGLLGPNGAGKTTTFRMLCGLVTPTSGQAFVEDVSLQDAPGEARSKIGYVAQKFSLYGNMTVKQNLDFFSGIYPVRDQSRREAVKKMIEIFSFDPYLSSAATSLPLGYKQRLALACSLMHRPDVLFLDEATSGVDPVTRREFWNHINGLVEMGTTVMITTHYMDEAEYCDRIGFLSRGKLVALGSPDELKKKVQSDQCANPTIEDAFIILCGGENHE